MGKRPTRSPIGQIWTNVPNLGSRVVEPVGRNVVLDWPSLGPSVVHGHIALFISDADTRAWRLVFEVQCSRPEYTTFLVELICGELGCFGVNPRRIPLYSGVAP